MWRFCLFLFLSPSSWIFACGLHFSWKTLPRNFFCWVALRFQEIMYTKKVHYLEKASGFLHKLKLCNILKTKQNLSGKTTGHCLLPFSSYRKWPTFLCSVSHLKTFNYNPAKYLSFATCNLQKCWFLVKTVKILISG